MPTPKRYRPSHSFTTASLFIQIVQDLARNRDDRIRFTRPRNTAMSLRAEYYFWRKCLEAETEREEDRIRRDSPQDFPTPEALRHALAAHQERKALLEDAREVTCHITKSDPSIITFHIKPYYNAELLDDYLRQRLGKAPEDLPETTRALLEFDRPRLEAEAPGGGDVEINSPHTST